MKRSGLHASGSYDGPGVGPC